MADTYLDRIKAKRQALSGEQSGPVAEASGPTPPPISAEPVPVPEEATQSPSRGLLDLGQDDWNAIFGTVYNEATQIPGGPLRLLGMAGEAGEQLAKGGSDSALGAFGNSAADVGTMGTFDAIAATDYAIKEHFKGGDFGKAFSERKQAINYGLAENRTEYPWATGAGSVAGGLASMAGPSWLLGAGAKALGMTGALSRHLILAPAIGGSEAAVYRYNSDGTTAEVMTDAAFGAMGAAMFSGLLGTTGWLYKRIRGTNVLPYEKMAAKELLDGYKIRNLSSGAEVVGETPEQALKRIKDSGAEAVVLDLYPEMAPFLKYALKSSSDSESKKLLVNLLQTRNQAQFTDAIKDAIGNPRISSIPEAKSALKALHSSLVPRYDAAIDAIDSGGAPFKVSTLLKDAQKLLGPENKDAGERGTLEVYKLFSKGLKDFAKRTYRGSEKAAPTMSSPSKPSDLISAAGLQQLRLDLEQRIGRAIKKRQNPAALMAVKDHVTNLLSAASDDYAALNKTYGDGVRVTEALKTGYKMFRDKQSDPTMFRDWLTSGGKSYAELKAFTDGVRRQLYERMKGVASPEEARSILLNNKATLDNLYAALGKQNTDDLINSVLAATVKETTRQSVAKGGGHAVRELMDTTTQISAADAMIAARHGGIESPTAQGIRATSRLLGLGGQSEAQQQAVRDLYAKGLTTPVSAMPELIKQLEHLKRYGNVGSLPEKAGMAGAVGGALASDAVSTARDEGLTTAIEQYLSGLGQ